MNKLSETIIQEYKYESREERDTHVKYMENQGFEDSGQCRRSDDNIMKSDREYYWFGRFYKNI